MPNDRLAIRRDAVSWVPTNDQVVILDLRTSRYLSLNATGTALWLRLAEGASVEELETTLRDSFGVDMAVATTDVDSFLDELRSRDLLVAPSSS